MMSFSIRHQLLHLKKDIILFLVLPAVLFPIYLYSLLPGTGFSGDTSKFQFLGSILGVGHEPGEPLYVLLTAVFQWLVPFESIAWRVNFFSAVAAVCSLCGLYYIQLRLGISRYIALGISLCSGLLYTFWSQAVIAEVYSLNACFAIWIVYFYIIWEQSKEVRYFYLATFLYALSFGNHISMITFLPALIVFVVLVDKKIFLNIRVIITVFFFILVGISQYVFIVHRTFFAPAGIYIEMAVENLTSFLYYIQGGQFASRLFPFHFPFLIIQKIADVGKYVVREFLFFIPFVVYGFYLLSVNNRNVAWLMLLSLVGNVLFVCGYVIDDIFVYLIPSYLIGMVFAAVALELLLQKVAKKFVILLFIVAIIALLHLNYSYASRRCDTIIDRNVENALRAADSNAVIFCRDYSYAMAFFYKYYCEGWKERNIHIIFSHGPIAPHVHFYQYLRGEHAIPVTVTREEISLGFRVFVFTGYNPHYQKHAVFKQPNYDQDIYAEYLRMRANTLQNYKHSNFLVTQKTEDLYELSLPSIQR